MTTWFLRSYADEDTHVGTLAPDGTVTAVCGAVFRPVLHPFDGTPACLTAPSDALQVCPRCRR